MAYRCGTTEAKNIIKRRKECVGPSFHAVLVEPCDMGPLPKSTWNGTRQIKTGQRRVEIGQYSVWTHRISLIISMCADTNICPTPQIMYCHLGNKGLFHHLGYLFQT